jgi:hypothetical protein
MCYLVPSAKNMNSDLESGERSAADIFLFGLGFFGAILAGAGVIGGSVPLALLGGLALLFSPVGLQFRAWLDE